MRALALVLLLLALPAQAAEERCWSCGPTCHLAWEADPAATRYEVRRVDTFELLGSPTASSLDFTCSGVPPFEVVAQGFDAGGKMVTPLVSERIYCLGEAGDANSDGEITSSDLTRWMRVLFLVGPTGHSCSLPRRPRPE